MVAQFQYKPLSSGQIRLLHLQPGTEDIYFTLESVNLSEDLDYEAISYCWGDPADTRTVYCDGLPLRVTNSLFTALKRLRLEEDSRVLWADAVCIDQGNTLEKNEQVKLMSQIYARPKRVLIWLGDDMSGLEGLEDSIRTALELLPPDSHDASVLQSTSQKIFREASVGRLELHELADGWLISPNVSRNCEKKRSPTSMITTGRQSTIFSVVHGSIENGSFKKWSHQVMTFQS